MREHHDSILDRVNPGLADGDVAVCELGRPVLVSPLGVVSVVRRREGMMIAYEVDMREWEDVCHLESGVRAHNPCAGDDTAAVASVLGRGSHESG